MLAGSCFNRHGYIKAVPVAFLGNVSPAVQKISPRGANPINAMAKGSDAGVIIEAET